METSVGKFTMKLFPDIAPEHCKNFKRLANSGFYDLTTFHRVIPGFMIQGGDILSRDFDDENDGTGGPGWTIDAEFNNYSHKKGVLSMARSSDPNSAGSQFFICVADAPHLDGKYTVFGEVTSKIHVIDRIVKAPTGYSIVKINSKKEIPVDEDPENWVTLKDPKTGETIYSKTPNGLNKNNYRTVQQKNLYSDRPMSDVIIKKVRVKLSEEK
ncbi:MAG: peptidylprolyl isomerase [Candidatus Marinimicrobia bacterium]|nr:peptidylprolyl isomerase [Candidatus Neomarinimicrobiota bacterium]